MSTCAIARLAGGVPWGRRAGGPSATTLADDPPRRRTMRRLAGDPDYTGRRTAPRPPPRRHTVNPSAIGSSGFWPSSHCCTPARGLGAREADFGGHFGEGGDDEGDVGVELDAELGRAAVDVVAVDGAREALVLELLLDRGRLKAGDRPARPDQGHRVHEARELVARVERLVQ